MYRGLWPQVIGKLAKYSVRFVDGAWKISVMYEVGEGLLALAVEGAGNAAADQINAAKQRLQGQPGGTFYVNEYRHIIVPINAKGGVVYHYVGRLESDFKFVYNGQQLSTKPITPDGKPLQPGQAWLGPRPGIPYVLAAGGRDIYYETPALTNDDPPQLMPMTTRKVQLSKVLKDNTLLGRATGKIAAVKGSQGGRFYVNENCAIFTPHNRGDGNGIEYIYCGMLDLAAWFPEPLIPVNSVTRTGAKAIAIDDFEDIKI
jgi:hypothetical protein